MNKMLIPLAISFSSDVKPSWIPKRRIVQKSCTKTSRHQKQTSVWNCKFISGLRSAISQQ